MSGSQDPAGRRERTVRRVPADSQDRLDRQDPRERRERTVQDASAARQGRQDRQDGRPQTDNSGQTPDQNAGSRHQQKADQGKCQRI